MEKINFSKKQLKEVVETIYYGVNPNLDKNDEIMKVAREIMQAYLCLHVPINKSIKYFFKFYKKNN